MFDIKTIAFRVIVFIFAVNVLFVIKNIYYQSIYTKQAQQQRGLDAVKDYEKVILFHVPLSPYTARAVEDTLKICKTFKDTKDSLYCYETLRSSLLQIKSFYQPYGDVLREITPVIAKIRAELMIEEGGIKTGYQQLYNSQLTLLEHDNTPSIFWSFLATLSLIIWLSSIIYGIYGNKIAGFSGFVIFFILWIVGLYMA